MVSFPFSGSGALPDPPWTSALGSLAQAGGVLVGGGGTFNISLYNLFPFANAQSAHCVLDAAAIDGFNNLIVRGNANNFYFLRFSTVNGFALERVLGGSFGSAIGADATLPVLGAEIDLIVDGGYQFEVYQNGVLLFTADDSAMSPPALAAGAPGVGAYDTSFGIATWSADGEIRPQDSSFFTVGL